MAKRKATQETPKQVLAAASFQDEEPDFPRGGVAALTPAEVQEARAQAEAEFEHEGKTRRKKQKKTGPNDDQDRAFIGKVPKSADLLRYKSLSIGMKLWGIILEIGKRDLVISLPGGLRGFVKAEEASDLLSSSHANEDLDAKVSAEEEGRHNVPLNELFFERQLVSCVVTKLDNSKLKENKKRSKRIGLSLRLSSLHNGLTIDAMHEGLVVQAFVTSIEDHGYLLSFGVPGITGFLLYSDQEAGVLPRLRKGQLVQGSVHSIDRKRGMVMLKADPDLVASNVIKELEGLTMELLVPGTLVNARVRAVLKNGLLLSFLTYFTGIVNIFHLEDPLPQSNWQEQYSDNQRLKARILYVDNATKSIGLTLNTHLIENKSPTIDVNIGEVFEKAVVRRVDSTIGLLLEIPLKEASLAGYVHISDASDDYIDRLQEKFKEGKVVMGRVIGKRLMDGLAVVTLKDSKVKQRLLSCADVQPGMTVQGEITTVEHFGAFVKLSDGVRALCPLQHMSEFQRTKPSAKFKVGAKMKFKVLACDAETKKITVTHKKTMLSSKLKPVISYEEAVEGLITHGWISGIEEYGCFVCFYNNVKGLAHRTELGLDPGVKPESAFQNGQVVKCRVLRADPSARRLSLSFILSPNRFLESQPSNNGTAKMVSVGDEVWGLIAHISDTLITLDVPLSHGMTRAVMKVELLSDSPGHIEHLKSVLFPGYKFERLLVLECDEQKLVVTSKFSFLSAKSVPSDISQLNAQEVIPGYIASITGGGCFVRFLGGLTGLASVPQLADGFVHDPSQHFSIGQSVRAQVLEVNLVSGRFTVSLKQSRCYSTDVSLLQGYFLEEDKIAELQAKNSDGADLDWGDCIDVGKCVEGEIQDIKEYGVIVNLEDHKDVVGFVTHHQVGSQVEVGKHVAARILDVVKSDGIVDLTLRPDLVECGTVSKPQSKKAGRKRARAGLEVQQKAWAVVELIKDEYLVLSLPDHGNAIAFASAHDYNLRVDPHQKYTLGQRVEVTVGALPETSGVGRLLLLLTSFSDPMGNPAVKRMKRPPKRESRTLVNGEVISVQPLEMKVKIGKNLIGKVHITQVWDEFAEENPLKQYTIGQVVTAKMLGRLKQTDDGNLIRSVDLTLRPSQLGLGDNHEESGAAHRLPTLASLRVGEVVTAYVKEVHDEWAWLLLSPSIMGRLFVLDSSTDPVQLGCFKERYQIGQALRCRIAKIDHEKGKLDLSLRGLDPTLVSNPVEQGEGVEIKVNDILGGRVSKIFPGVGGLSVQVGAHLFGRVHITHLHDNWKDNPTRDFLEGQFVRCVVLDVNKSASGSVQVDLSLKDSLLSGQGNTQTNGDKTTRLPAVFPIEKIEDLKVDMEVQGFVKSVTKKGCFVTLSRHVDARILLSNLSETFIDDPDSLFPVGILVTGRIVSMEPLSGFVEMSLKSSSLKSASKDSKFEALKDMHVGDVVSGAVSRIENYGLFILINNSGIVGLCHISEISDSYIKNLEVQYRVGDRVRAKILKIDEGKKQISLGMKETYLKNRQSEAENSNEDKTNSDFKGEQVLEENSDSDLSSERLDNRCEDRNVDQNSTLLIPPMPEAPQVDYSVPPLEVVLERDENMTLDDMNMEEKQNRVSGSTSEDLEKPSKRGKKRLKELREAAIRAAEQKRLEGDEAPESAEDFEKLAHASPNSSFIWIKYMAFLLSLGDVDKARGIAERALQTINFREEGEKLNVWVALLNLENVYGNPAKEATLGVFQRALKYCDPKKLYLALLGIYERSEQHDMADELLKTMLQKFKTSSKVWLRRIQYLLKQGMPEATHKALDRALLSLPHRKHIKIISQAAVSEFKIGSPERARNLFEGILRNYPKRADLWSVYLDQEIGLGDVLVVRALFERATSLELPPKKMKFLFKKYLDYEKSHGNEEQIVYVKGKAMQYVESRLG